MQGSGGDSGQSGPAQAYKPGRRGARTDICCLPLPGERGEPGDVGSGPRAARDRSAMAQNVLITGAAGFIGSSIAARLGAAGDRVVGLDN